MRIAVLGATGRTGALVVELALERGHEVVALTRAARPPAAGARLTYVTGDAHDAKVIGTLVGGCDAVVSALGSGGARPVDVYSSVARHLVDVLSQGGPARLVAITSRGAGDGAASDPASRAVTESRHGPVVEDMTRMERIIREADADWTIVRPGGLSDGPLVPYRVHPADVPSGAVTQGSGRTPRACVAHFIVGELEEPRWVRRAVTISVAEPD